MKINNETLLELIVKSIYKNNINNNYETKYLPDDNINDSLTNINSGGGDYLTDSKSKITSQSHLSANVCFYVEENTQEYEIQLELSDIKTSNDVYNFIQYILSEVNFTPDTTDMDSMCSNSPSGKNLDLIPYYCGFKEEPGFGDNFNIELSTFINQNNSRMAGASSPFVKPYIVDVMDTIKEETETDVLKIGQINKIDIEKDPIDNNKSKNTLSSSDDMNSCSDFYDIIPVSPQISETKLNVKMQKKQNTAVSSPSSSPVSTLSYNLINDVYINSWKRIYNFFSLKKK